MKQSSQSIVRGIHAIIKDGNKEIITIPLQPTYVGLIRIEPMNYNDTEYQVLIRLTELSPKTPSGKIVSSKTDF